MEIKSDALLIVSKMLVTLVLVLLDPPQYVQQDVEMVLLLETSNATMDFKLDAQLGAFLMQDISVLEL